MFERFTGPARQVIVFAQAEARALRHGYIGTEHLLLGLLREEEGLGAQVLVGLDITLDRVRGAVARVVGSGEDVISGQIPFTPRAKKACELALRESLALGHKFIGTEHLLLGLVGVHDGVAERILLGFDADSTTIRTSVLDEISRPGTRPSAAVPLIPRSMAIAQLPAIVKRELRRLPDEGDYLLALAAPHGVVGIALDRLGIELPALRAALDAARAELPPGGPEERALRALRERLGLPPEPPDRDQ